MSIDRDTPIYEGDHYYDRSGFRTAPVKLTHYRIL